MAITPLGQLSGKNEDDADCHIKGRQGDDSEPRKCLGMREVEGDEEALQYHPQKRVGYDCLARRGGWRKAHISALLKIYLFLFFNVYILPAHM